MALDSEDVRRLLAVAEILVSSRERGIAVEFHSIGRWIQDLHSDWKRLREALARAEARIDTLNRKLSIVEAQLGGAKPE